jgi:hypothetical protein
MSILALNSKISINLIYSHLVIKIKKNFTAAVLQPEFAELSHYFFSRRLKRENLLFFGLNFGSLSVKLYPEYQMERKILNATKIRFLSCMDLELQPVSFLFVPFDTRFI